MTGALAGRRIGILQTRYAKEFANLVARIGGIPVLAPCLREVRVEDAASLRAALQEVSRAPVDVFVFQTGVGAAALMDLADEMGLAGVLAERVRAATVIARGPKPLTVLLRHGFEVAKRTAPPHTTEQLFTLLQPAELAGRRVAVQNYGRTNRPLLDHLAGSGAEVIELEPYRWALPEDPAPVHELLRQLAASQLAAVVFTSAAQVENLFAIAADQGRANALPDQLNQMTVTAAIGPTCARALVEHGVRPTIQPDNPKMVPLVQAVAQYFSGPMPQRTEP